MMLTRGKIAKATGWNSETIRYYEKIGLLREPPRSESGYRLYDESYKPILRFIKRAKSLGFSTNQVRDLLRLTEQSALHTRSEVKSLTDSHIRELSEKIKELQKLKKQLSEISSQCDGSDKSAADCPILTSLIDED
jgi:MerR family transcriptional regulator, mercuric resistance operon regulatory protein